MFIFSSAQLAAATIFLFLVKLIGGNTSLEIALKNETGFCVSKTLALQYQREICCLELEMVHPKTGSCISPCALKHQALRYDLDGFLACVCTSPFKLIHDEYLETKKMCGCLSPTGKAYGTIFHDGEDICCVGEPIQMGKKRSKCKPNDRVNSHKVCPYLSRWDEMSGECLCNIAGQVKVGGVCRCENVGHMIDPSNTKCVSRCKPFQKWDARLNTCVCAGELVQAGRLGILKCAKKTEITCRTHEYFNGKLCICEDGYWRASELDECQIKPTCGPREVRNRQTNMCQCKPEHSRWSSNVCLPTCSIEHTHRVGGEDYACECVQGYTWKDYDQTSCKPLPMCGNKERYDGVFTFRCICIANYERLGEFGCQPKCVTSNSRRVKPATNTNTAVVDEGCECISGYHWNDPSSVARKSCDKNPVCGVFESFDGRLCACLTGYWRDSDGKKCQKKKPQCGPRESHDKPTNSCLCDHGYERWENNACLPICGLKHSHRIGEADDACACKSGYSWDSGFKSSCVKAFPNGQWPVSRGKKTFSSVHIVKSGEIFDGGMYTYDRSDIKCDRRGTWRDAVFRVEAGGILKNVLIGKNQREGVPNLIVFFKRFGG